MHFIVKWKGTPFFLVRDMCVQPKSNQCIRDLVCSHEIKFGIFFFANIVVNMLLNTNRKLIFLLGEKVVLMNLMALL